MQKSKQRYRNKSCSERQQDVKKSVSQTDRQAARQPESQTTRFFTFQIHQLKYISDYCVYTIICNLHLNIAASRVTVSATRLF